MIEPIMFFGGGFLVASLLALILISFVHNRAVRLTQRRLEDAIPVSMAEIQAKQDLLRAEYAVSARRLEMTAEQLQAKATAQLGEIARKSEAINRLKAELAAKNAVTDELDATAKSLGGKLHDLEQQYAVKAAAAESAERALAAAQGELATALNEIKGHKLETDTQRVEIAVLKTQAEQLRSQVEEMQQDAQDAARRLFDERVALSTATKELQESRQAVELLRPQVAQFERELAARTAELRNRAQQIEALEQRGADLQRQLHDRDAEIAALRQQMETDKDRHEAMATGLRAEKEALHGRLETTVAALAAHADQIHILESQTAERDRQLAQRDAEAQALLRQIAATDSEHRDALERLDAEMQSLERLLQTANHTLETRASRIDDLESWVAERERLLQQRDAEIAALRQEIAAGKDEAAAEGRRWEAEKTELLGRIDDAQRIRNEAQADLIALQTEADATWKAERLENALLRERITDIAAQIAHMAINAENAGSPLTSILNDNTSLRPEAFETAATGETQPPHEPDLSARIRALQTGT